MRFNSVMHRYRLLAALTLLSFPAAAQFSGRIAGTVLDSSGAPVPAATVTLTMPGSTKALLSAKTASDGAYHLIGIRPSDYDLHVEASGFTKATLKAVAVDPARETEIPTITLQLATLSQSVNVTTSSESVQTANAEISATVDVDQVQKLP